MWLEIRHGRMTTEKGTEPPAETQVIGRLRLEGIRTTNGIGEVAGFWPECPFEKIQDQTNAIILKGDACSFYYAWLVEVRPAAGGKNVVLRYRKREGELPDLTSSGEAPQDHGTHAAAHPHPGFIAKYIFSTDHKMIGVQYITTAVVFGILGGLLAMGIRWQLAWPFDPAHPIPVLADALWKDAGGVMPSDFYNQFVTMHGTIMVFFFVIPLMVGGFGNFLVPLMIGADDMAFPRINMWSYWVYFVAGIVMAGSFFVPGGAAQGGWTSYPPLASAAYQTQNWKLPGTEIYLGGVDLWLLAIVLVGASSLMGAINYITTSLNMRAKGMSLMRMPLFVWAILITSVLNLLAVPVLTAGGIMLFFDRVIGTAFFNPAATGEAAAGQVLLWQHLFWFFGHPEVYIIILPGMGVVSEILPAFSRKPIFGYAGMVIAMSAIGGLGFIVWGHHMFTSGMSPVMGTAFMVSTMAIAIPSAIKVFNWIGTLWGGQIRYRAPLLAGVGFVAMFIIGGLSGIFLAATAVDTYVHDTYFVVAHFHYVAVSASIFAIIGGIYYWFPKMRGRRTNDNLGVVHVILTFVFLNLTFFPMHFAGLAGHMRRIASPETYVHIKHLTLMNKQITMMAFGLFAAQILFLGNLAWSFFFGKPAGENPWEANTLEWQAPSPPPHGNFTKPIEVFHGAYEYAHPSLEADFAPQNTPIPGGAGGHS